MRYFRTNAFKRLYRKLPPDRRQAVDQALKYFDEMLIAGHPAVGLGLKELRRDVWEIRAGLRDRIIFCKSKDTVEFLALGSHDQIRRFLKNL